MTSIILCLLIAVLAYSPVANGADALKQPDQNFYSMLNGLDEDSLDEEVVDSPKVFIEKYLPAIGQLIDYDIDSVPDKHKRDILTLFNNVGTAFIRLGQYKNAITPLRVTVMIDPEEPVCRRNLALALKRSGMISHDWKLLERSLDEYRAVLKIEKDKTSDLRSEAERSIAEIVSFQEALKLQDGKVIGVGSTNSSDGKHAREP